MFAHMVRDEEWEYVLALGRGEIVTARVKFC